MGANAPSPSDLADGWYGSVDISRPNIHLRGMDRNSVIVDGTNASAAGSCSSAPADQNSLNGEGRNGIVIWKANNVSVDNLTVCNFLAGSGNAGNGIWWNGGSGSGAIGLVRYSGSYLTATSTYFANSDPSHLNVCGTCSLYGIFSSDSTGPSQLSQLYANNFSDSGIYVGACKRACDVTIDHAWMENNALGYSGTNSGGRIVVQNSQFDNNKDGFDTNTALTGDPPPPQDGRCWAQTSRDHREQHVLGVHPQHGRFQQQPQCPDLRNRRPRPDRHGDDDLRWPLRHHHGQYLPRQRCLGRRIRPVSRWQYDIGRPNLRRHQGVRGDVARHLRALVPLRPAGGCVVEQQVLRQRDIW